MPSAVTHGFAGILLGNAVSSRRKLTLCAVSAFCSVLPDLDVVGVWLGADPAGIWGHRGFTHSLFFALLVGLAMASFVFREEKPLSRRWGFFVFYFFAVTAFHGVLDGINDSPFGVAYFAPFSSARYLLPYHPLPGIGISGFFTHLGNGVFMEEITFIWLPGIVATVAMGYGRRRSASAKTEALKATAPVDVVEPLQSPLGE